MPADIQNQSGQGVQLAYEKYEPDENCGKPPIIIIHGIGFNSTIYREMSELLCEKTKRTIYVPDLRNHGDSPYGKQFTLYLCSEDIRLFMAEHNIDKACFIGHSLGVKISFLTVIENPACVEKIVFVDLLPYDTMEEQDYILINSMVHASETFLNNVVSWLPYDAVLLLARRVLNTYHESDQWPNLIPKVMRKDPLKGIVIAFDFERLKEAILNESLLIPIDGDYNGETLVISGGDSSIYKTRLEGRQLEHYPNTKFAVIAGCSHNLPNEKPEEFTELVTEFLRSD